MKLTDYGLTKYLESGLIELNGTELSENNIGRITVENKTNFGIATEYGELAGLVMGKFRKSAQSVTEFPKVGDWIKFEKLQGEDKAVIKEILPRASVIARKAAGEGVRKKPQIIATNIDIVFIVAGMDQDFNLPLLERYLHMAQQGGAKPVLVLNKADLASNHELWQKDLDQLQQQGFGIDSIIMSAKTGDKLENLREHITTGTTVVFVGPSGAGKSSILNRLVGEDLQSTGSVREGDNKGRHTTTKREMFILDTGGILIDTPGIRELENIDDDADQSQMLFPKLSKLADDCRYRNCDHIKSKGCAILKAIDDGELSKGLVSQYLQSLNSGQDIKVAHEKKRSPVKKHIAKNLRRFYKSR